MISVASPQGFNTWDGRGPRLWPLESAYRCAWYVDDYYSWAIRMEWESLMSVLSPGRSTKP